MGQALRVAWELGGGLRPETVEVSSAVIAGWTGRDKAALEKHIAELEELGVKRPPSTPVFYRVAAARVTCAPVIEATGTASSGEVEYILLRHGGQTFVGVGSDHTDRDVETYGITISKQLCDKPIAPKFWAWDDVAPHWDEIVTRAWIEEGGEKVLYQEGKVSAMLSPIELVSIYTGGRELADGTLMFCGTHAAKGGIRPSGFFEFEIADPVLNRSIRHGYRIETLPIAG